MISTVEVALMQGNFPSCRLFLPDILVPQLGVGLDELRHQVDAGLIRELRRLGGLAKLGIRTPGMAESGRHALADIRSAIAHLAEPPS